MIGFMWRIAALRRSGAVSPFALVALPGQQQTNIRSRPGPRGEAGERQQPVERTAGSPRPTGACPPARRSGLPRCVAGSRDECGEQQRAVDEEPVAAPRGATHTGWRRSAPPGWREGVHRSRAGEGAGRRHGQEPPLPNSPPSTPPPITPGPRGAGRGLAAVHAAQAQTVGHPTQTAEQGGHQRDRQHPQQRTADGLADGAFERRKRAARSTWLRRV